MLILKRQITKIEKVLMNLRPNVNRLCIEEAFKHFENGFNREKSYFFNVNRTGTKYAGFLKTRWIDITKTYKEHGV